ncbi:MAG TPA: hypothetical protein PK141_01145 [Polyangiaceae bacterium]|jgi:tetratricopeptide (TPR) repeat protein|nr:hypothetical protein [Polyangiaceae bacterium]
MPSEADDAYRRALELANRGDFPAALLAVQEALAKDAGRVNLHNLAGYILLSLNEPVLTTASLVMFERSLELWPDHSVALGNWVDAVVKLGCPDFALARLEEESKGRRRAAAVRSHGRLLLRLGQPELALPKLEEAAEGDAALHVELGEARLALKDALGALESFETAIRFQRGGEKPHLLRVQSLLELELFRSAWLAASTGSDAATTAAGTRTLEAARQSAAEALSRLGVLVPSPVTLAFEVEAEDERPLAWTFRGDDEDVRSVRVAFRAGRAEEALTSARAALRVPNRHPTVIVALSRWAGRRAQCAHAVDAAVAWKELEIEAAEQWFGWSENGGEAASTRLHIDGLGRELEGLKREKA